MKLKKLFAGLIFCFILQALAAQEWYVCLASFRNQENARNYAEVLGKYDLPSWVYFSSTPKGDFYRVLYEVPSATIEQARIVRDKVSVSKGARTMQLKGLWVCEAQKTTPPAPDSAPTKADTPAPAPTPTKADTLILTTNQKQQDITSEEKPYSVHIKSYKEETPAVRDKERLEKKDIDAYVLKSYDEDTYFSFDLHAGAFEKEEDTRPLIEKLEDLGIEGAQVADYSDLKDAIEQYNEIVDTTTVSASQGNFEIPDSFSAAVQAIISEYPINPNFQLEAFELYDIDNIIKNYGTTQDFDTLQTLFICEGLSTNINALSYAVYNDSLFNKQFDYIVATGPKSCFTQMKERMQNNPAAVSIPLKVKGQIYNGWYTLENTFLTIQAFSKNCDAIVMLISSRFTREEIQPLLDDFSNDSSILVYPQIRKNLLTLPKNNPAVHRDFIFFSINQVDETYAQERDYVDWSIPVIGHWQARNLFFQDGKKISTSFFDLDYDYNASKNHQMFMTDHYKYAITDDNHPCEVNDSPGWYFYSTYKDLPSNEVSFSYGVYIIAVDSYEGGFFTEQELISFAEELQIWDRDGK